VRKKISRHAAVNAFVVRVEDPVSENLPLLKNPVYLHVLNS
jgi:hypothetical protein